MGVEEVLTFRWAGSPQTIPQVGSGKQARGWAAVESATAAYESEQCLVQSQ